MKGTILANKIINNFNQSISIIILNILFTNPINLSNLHQSWLINTTNSLSNINVAAEIVFIPSQTDYSSSYQSEINIKQSFCINEQFNQAFLINRLQSIEAKDYLYNNLINN
ncbi:unnamed protein product [Rotaria sp. Silwood1]|nr:unnamed protein product [Rotaria sp. Silwood1]CAF1676210.1 unnamed protein product [Rotaria sp. Silwood1]CAF3747066.1 unnamed protein product [Rotaria sp. Silwood1]CAF3810588.1 unnamed protein product [Rotaria sp. Silwood1]CAF3905426.1 unnamed protein product [Rotaria sp. Silwood1]